MSVKEEPELESNDEDLDPALAAALAEVESFKDKHLRAVAEMQNIQRRAQRDLEDANKYAVTSAAKPFLMVADHLARALQALPPDLNTEVKNFVDGIRSTQRELQTALEKMGVTAISPETGQMLNPHEHEVMFEVDSSDYENGAIVQVLETGYKIHDRLLRPARVSVAKSVQGLASKEVDLSA
jgi:molecular chaperone GrpE